MFCKKVFLDVSQNSLKNLCAGISLQKGCRIWNIIKRLREKKCFCKIFQNTYFEEHLQTAASDHTSVLRPLFIGKSHKTSEYFTIDKWDLGIIPL